MKVKIKEIEVRMLRDIPDSLCMTDVGADRSAFDRIMEHMYQKKQDWNGNFTRFIILCIQKVHRID